MTKIMLATTAFISLTVSAQAATITSYEPNYHGYKGINIVGEIVEGDARRFNAVMREVSAEKGKAIVSLNSIGGLLAEGFAIGHAIHNNDFGTVAEDNCTSSCANIWLAGTKRWIVENSTIGFHRGADIKKGKDGKEISRKMDPRIDNDQRAYYHSIGYTNEAGIAWFLSASTYQMAYLGDDNGPKYGIDYGIVKRRGAEVQTAENTVQKVEQTDDDTRKAGPRVEKPSEKFLKELPLSVLGSWCWAEKSKDYDWVAKPSDCAAIDFGRVQIEANKIVYGDYWSKPKAPYTVCDVTNIQELPDGNTYTAHENCNDKSEDDLTFEPHGTKLTMHVKKTGV
jgi:ATP-dependent protease ClpP protease subunit